MPSTCPDLDALLEAVHREQVGDAAEQAAAATAALADIQDVGSLTEEQVEAAIAAKQFQDTAGHVASPGLVAS